MLLCIQRMFVTCYNHRIAKTPFEQFTGEKPNVSNMHSFGTVCYGYVQNPKKLDARSEKGIFLGYDKGSPAYLVYYPESESVKRIRCVKFTRDVETEPDDGSIVMRDKPEPVPIPKPTVQVEVEGDQVVGEVARPEHTGDEQHAEIKSQRRNPERGRKKPKYLENYDLGVTMMRTVSITLYIIVTG